MIASTALSYLRSGLCVLPAIVAQKRPALSAWKPYQQCLPSEAQVTGWFTTANACCLLAGAVSGNLEMLDFDCAAEAFDAWAALVEARAPGLLARLVIEQSQSGGRHVVYRCQVLVPGNGKLAQRVIMVPDSDPVVVGSKELTPRRVGDHFEVTVTLIETRGEGGLFLCAPSPGYALTQGSLESLPVLTDAERSVLIGAARSLDQTVQPQGASAGAVRNGAVGEDAVGSRPGDDYNERGDVRELLIRHGWRMVKPGDNEYWCRPGKDAGTSATLKDRVFYVFSSSAAPLEPDTAYAPFRLYALLEHGGDYAAAAAALRVQGYGDSAPDTSGVDLSAFTTSADRPIEPVGPSDPGAMPAECLRIPGFVSQVMDFCTETAPYPNQVLAFCGALALQSFLAARKVRDSGDNRTNLYLLGLAHSASGKDWPRRVNTSILWQVGLGACVGDKFASGEGLQDALFQTPAMLFQTDEIDGMLLSISRSRDARYESIITTLLTMYTSSAGVYPMRRKAGKGPAGEIHQPSLTVFGTAIPNHYYQALSERLLTNGFFARTLVLEAGSRSDGQEPSIRDVPAPILATARWWADYRPAGDLQWERPTPTIVPQTEQARDALVEIRRRAEQEYRVCEANSDMVGTTVWGRVSENVRKLALLYAISENHTSPQVGEPAVRWAGQFVDHQTRRMLFMAATHVADNDFDGLCLRAVQKLRDEPAQQINHSVLLKRMKLRSTEFDELMKTLVARGDVEPVADERSGSGPRAVSYRLR